VIVSKGPPAEQIRLHDNMCGEGYLPQPSILPQVDLVDHARRQQHDVRALHHGKPMVVLPIFWDQYDNAQRVHETASACAWRPTSARPRSSPARSIRLLADDALRQRLAAMAQRLQGRVRTVAAAGLIERLAR
jgi:UDP:flavonoid glycosyltransferase YjiC (YdhE family)